jgi:hypothetical protein
LRVVIGDSPVAKELAKPFYYSRWHKCVNNQCKTTLIIPKDFWMFRKPIRCRVQPRFGCADLVGADATDCDASA